MEFTTIKNAKKDKRFSFIRLASTSFILFVFVFIEASFAQSDSEEKTTQVLDFGGIARLGGDINEAEVQKNNASALNSSGERMEHLGETFSPRSIDNRVSNVSNLSAPQKSTDDSEESVDDNIGELELDATQDESNDDSCFQNLLTVNPKELFSSENGWFGRDGISTTLKTLLVMAALALVPAIFLMTTSFIRISVVLAFLRQALGAGQIPSNQVISAISVVLTVLIMTPVWSDVYDEAIEPYSSGEITNLEALDRGQAPIRNFLWRQIERSGNTDIINVFTQYIPNANPPEFFEDVPWRALGPAFVVSELKTAFLIGFQVFLPFLIIDVIVSCVLVSAGMMMLPPAIVSLPFKLILFVLVDGWTLVVRSLLDSFAWSIGG